MRNLLGRLTTGRIVQDIQIIAEHFGCSSITVHRMHSNFKAEKQIENERILQSAIWVEARPSQPQALGFAGQPSYFAHATPLTSSVLANARSNRKLHEVMGRSRQFAWRPARYRPPGQQSAHPKHKCFLAFHNAFHDCRRLLSCFDSACPRWDHRLIRPSVQDRMESTMTDPGLEPGAYTGGSAATVSALPVHI